MDHLQPSNSPSPDELRLRRDEPCEPNGGARPGGSPAGEVLAPQSSRFDERLAAALQAAPPVPPGLESRLMAALAFQIGSASTGSSDSPAGEPALPATVAPASVAPASAAPVGRPARFGDPRQRWFVASVTSMALLVAAISVIGNFWQKPGEAWGPERVMQLVRDFESALPADVEADWRLSAADAPPANLPLASAVRAAGDVHWRPIQVGSLDRSGVVYRLTGADGARGRLYVLPWQGSRGSPSFTGLPTEPAQTEAFTTMGTTSFAWTDGDRLYVLIVPGDPTAAEPFLRQFGPLS